MLKMTISIRQAILFDEHFTSHNTLKLLRIEPSLIDLPLALQRGVREEPSSPS